MIVLDVAAVGTGRGVPTLPLCRELAARFPQLRLITGGGLRTTQDLLALNGEPLDAVLVATALHNGAIR
jgi:phosphoribosylformimino-5-aminoimidazole carboxamide ribotide isomerase